MPAVTGRRLAVLACLTAGYLVIIKTSLFVVRAVGPDSPLFSSAAFPWSVPLAMVPLVGAVFFDRGAAVVLLAAGALVIPLTVEQPFPLVAILLFGGLTATLALPKRRTRSAILAASLRIAVANAAAAAALVMMDGQPAGVEMLLAIVGGIAGGLLSGALALMVIPVIETVFQETTDVSLMELLDMTHPLLRKLVLEAPGTYHHAIMVGNLAEAAAEEVGANPLLARVGAYYHDVGKLSKPEYFIENIAGAENIHDRLAPSMSALVITSHIKEGLDLARRNKLPGPVLDIIGEHHGTAYIGYFLKKAKEGAVGKGSVLDDDFRYPGPKPRGKEAAIVMLADQVEAATRAMKSPDETKIRALIQKIFNDNFADGQLNQCRITLHELQKVAQSFDRILEGMVHLRVDYPNTEALTGSTHLRKGRYARGR